MQPLQNTAAQLASRVQCADAALAYANAQSAYICAKFEHAMCLSAASAATLDACYAEAQDALQTLDARCAAVGYELAGR